MEGRHAGVGVLLEEKPLGAFPDVHRGVGPATPGFCWLVCPKKVRKERWLMWFGLFVVDMGSVEI